MSSITVPLPEEDMRFLRRYASEQGTSVEEFVARQARCLRERLERPLPPSVTAATGIITRDAGKADQALHLEAKHA